MSQPRPTQNAPSGEAPSLAGGLHDSLSPGLVVVDEREQILCCTPEAERLLRLKSGRTVGGGLDALPAAIRKIAHQVAASRQAVGSRVVTLTAGKSAPTVRVSATPIPAGEGKFQVLVFVNDVAVLQRLEQNLDRLDRLARVGTLSAGMAHEIKNALVAVKTFVDLLLEKNPDAELGGIVGRELKRIDTLLSQMLRFRAPARTAPAVVHVHDVLEHSLRMLQHLFDTKLITVHRQFSAAGDAVEGDDYQLEQAFVNLFFNALEAMSPSGVLTVTTANPVPTPSGAERRLLVTVADDGLGISPENMARLFEPFFTTKQNGTGLGMAITRRIIHEHGGEITAHSKPNRGTKFEILLPVQE